MPYSRLFEPLKVGEKLTLKNRLVMAPMTTTSGEPDGSFSSEEIAYLTRRAKAGVSLIMTPACYCHKTGHAFERQVGCHADEMLHSLGSCAEAINKAGAASFLQIHHGGNAAKQALSSQPPLAPSSVHNRRGTSELPQPLTENEIRMLIEAFSRAAGRAKKAGFTGIELHGANTYLFQQFFSAFTNKRDDKWGVRPFENRVRFASEVVKAVRKEVGPAYPVAYRISPEEEDPEGYSAYEAIDLLKVIVPLGIDIVHVSTWEYGRSVRGDCPTGSHPTRLIRDALPKEIPVIGVGGILHPRQALCVREDGVDLVALGRALLLDADWAAKAQSGEEGDIRTAIYTEDERASLEIPDRMKTYTKRMLPLTPGKE